MKIRTGIIAIVAIVALNILADKMVVRWDMTADKRYSLSSSTRNELKNLDSPLSISILLDGELNSGFTRLLKASEETIREMGNYAKIVSPEVSHEERDKMGLTPTVIHERTKDGRSAQTEVYPYACIRYHGRSVCVGLLQNHRGLSGEDNLNHSIETLEYTLVEAIHSLAREKVEKIAFLEGHNEMTEREVYDISLALSRYFQIDRGVIGDEAGILDDYKCLIIAGPQMPFNEQEKYIIDQYLMAGGRILWLVDGIRLSSEMLSTEGMTPIIPLELNLTDMLFRYGVRISPVLVQDIQCLPIPVDMSEDPSEHNYQPMPWTYAPLLLTNDQSPITKGLMQVSGTMVSALEWVGGEDGLRKEILMATSSASAWTQAPGKVDLGDLNIDKNRFQYAYLPVATLLEGKFESLYAHRMAPDGVKTQHETIKTSQPTRQVVVATSSIIRNEWQQGQPLPLGFDRYTQTQFANRDFIVNTLLYLTDDSGLINLRQKSVCLRLLNDKRAHEAIVKIQILTIILPILMIALIGLTVGGIRRKLYIK